jgi:hypothetical protein
MRSGPALNAAMSRAFRGRRDRRPVHLFLNYCEAHEPYMARSPGDSGANALGRLPSINLARHTDYLAPTGEGSAFLATYMRSLRDLDSNLRVAFDLFRKYGLLEDAVILFVSDHGQSLGEHGFYGHGHYLYDELVRIPGFLLEYRDSALVPVRPPTSDWVDLRHVFDVLMSAGPEGGPIDLDRTLTESLSRRGPAVTFWEGPAPRPPKGFFHSPPRSEIYRLLRVVRGERAATLSDGMSATAPTTLPEEGGVQSDPELAVLAGRYLTKGRVEPTAPVGLNATVDARLKSWGYD